MKITNAYTKESKILCYEIKDGKIKFPGDIISEKFMEWAKLPYTGGPITIQVNNSAPYSMEGILNIGMEILNGEKITLETDPMQTAESLDKAIKEFLSKVNKENEEKYWFPHTEINMDLIPIVSAKALFEKPELKFKLGDRVAMIKEDKLIEGGFVVGIFKSGQYRISTSTYLTCADEKELVLLKPKIKCITETRQVTEEKMVWCPS